MTKHNRIAKLCFVAAILLILLTNLCTVSLAAAPNLDQKCSVTFTMAYSGTTLSDCSLTIYRIASWENKNGTYGFTWVPELADAGLDLSEKDTELFAQRIFMLVESRSLPAITSRITNGKTMFVDLECGLYVVYQTESAEGYEPINPFCISLPMQTDIGFVYDIVASPKPRPEKPTETTTSESDSEDEDSEEPTNHYDPSTVDKLPDTGQLWWPTWTLGIAGFVLLGLGIVLRTLFREDTEEAES